MPTPTTEEKRTFIINVAYYGLIAAAVFLGAVLFFRYLLPVLYPFVLAYLLALFLHPAMMFLHKRAGLPKGVGAFLVITAAVAAVFAVGYLLVERLVAEIANLTERLGKLQPQDFAPLKAKVDSFLVGLPFIDSTEDTARLWQAAGDKLQSFVTDSLPGLSGTVSMIAGVFTGLLDFTLVFIITVVSCYYMTVDRARISALAYKVLPNSVGKHLRTARLELFGAVGKYLKAYGIIILITFTELLVAFTVLRLDYALLLAAVIALIDILPVLGTGTVLVPWALICLFITRDFYLGTGLIITYVVITVIRQIIEPKIIGGYIGMHPLATMVAMFAGLRLFGITGMLLLPFLALICRNIYTKAKNAN